MAHAAHHQHAASPAGLGILSLPEGVLSLVCSHLSIRDCCSVRMSCKAWAAALAGLHEATLKGGATALLHVQNGRLVLRSPSKSSVRWSEQILQQCQQSQAAPNQQTYAGLIARIRALRRKAPLLSSLILDLTAMIGIPDIGRVRSVLAACAGLQRLVVRCDAAVAAAFSSVQEPCASALLDACITLGAEAAEGELVMQAVHNGWSVGCIKGTPRACDALDPAAWAVAMRACVVLQHVDPFGEDALDPDQLDTMHARLATTLERLPTVELQNHVQLQPPAQLLQVATHLKHAWYMRARQPVMEVPAVHEALDAGDAARLQSISYLMVGHVSGISAVLADQLQVLHLLWTAGPGPWTTCLHGPLAGCSPCTPSASHLSYRLGVREALGVTLACCVRRMLPRWLRPHRSCVCWTPRACGLQVLCWRSCAQRCRSCSSAACRRRLRRRPCEGAGAGCTVRHSMTPNTVSAGPAF